MEDWYEWDQFMVEELGWEVLFFYSELVPSMFEVMVV